VRAVTPGILRGYLGTTIATLCATEHMLKIRGSSNGDVVLTISGSLQVDNLSELSALLGAERGQRGVVLDLKELVIVDGDAVRFLCACESEGIVLRNCPRYVSAWMERERDPATNAGDPPCKD
jgi:hypothetical protein